MGENEGKEKKAVTNLPKAVEERLVDLLLSFQDNESVNPSNCRKKISQLETDRNHQDQHIKNMALAFERLKDITQQQVRQIRIELQDLQSKVDNL